ncbi:ethanolamine ammonia-lyase light chain EutC [Escherichia coli]
MGQAAPAPSEAKCATTNCAAPVTSESCALDLGSAEAKAWIGVENPHRADVLTELRRSTVARVCTGRAGPRPRTQALLRFLADHSRSKDTVLKEVPEEWVKAQGLLEVRSEISDKNLYLTRPDMGRRLCAEAVEALKAQLNQMANAIDTSIFVKNGPCIAGLGLGGEGWTTMTITTPTGEGVTSARTFVRLRRCVLVDAFRIV